MNLMKHRDDFAVNAERNSFATSHGKNACNGAAAHASLQRAKEKQILTLINYSCAKSPTGCSDFDHIHAV